MASGKFTYDFGSSTKKYQLITEWSSVATTATNSSVVTVTMKLYVPYSLYIGARSNNSVSINGVAYTYNSSAISTDSGGITYTLGTITSSAIAHNADGTKSIPISGSFKLNATIGGVSYTTITASGTAVLDSIPRGATIVSAPDFTDEENPTITYTNPAGTAATLNASIYLPDGYTYVVGYRTIDNSEGDGSYTFNLTDADRERIYELMGDSTTLTVRFYIRSTIGGSYLYSTANKTITLVNGNPVIAPTVIDTNSTTTALTGDSTKLIKGYSSVSANINATAIKGSTLTSTYITHAGKTYDAFSVAISGVESNTFTFSATDSRGLTSTSTKTCTMIDYTPITISIDNNSPDTDGNFQFKVSGAYFSGSFGSKSNSINVYYRYKSSSGSFGSWSAMTVALTATGYYAFVDLTGLDYQETYTFEAYAADRLETTATVSKNIKSLPVFDWSGEDFNFNVPVNFSAGATGIETGGGVYYGTCATGASTTTKVVVCEDFTELKVGACINVNFTYANTANYPKLNVNGTGAKSITYVSTNTYNPYRWNAGEVVQFVYDGTYWKIVDGGVATTSYWGATRLHDTVDSNTAYALTPNAVNKLIEYGTWVPTCNVIASPTQAEGYYTRIGNMCSVSFIIYGTTTSGGTTTNLTIDGLPFYPDENLRWQAGGGQATNIYTIANHNFSGYNIEGGEGVKKIYVRSAATTTAAGSRASNYCTSEVGKTVYMSGCITYKIDDSEGF